MFQIEKEKITMNQYERRFYEDIHKLVIIQEKILKELQKMNKPLQVYEAVEPVAVDKNVKCKVSL